MWPGVTRFSLVCLRFDDYHQDVDNETWVEVLSQYDDAGLRGVIGVVPKYEGERLSADVVGFLDDLRESGWELAQHGYTHENVGEGRGGLLYQEQSEFAGLEYEEQRRRIGAGRDILESHGIEPTTFIPPWHEYDRTTARALDEAGFDCINEGRWPIPRTIEGVTLVPTHVPGVTPEMAGAGIVTIVNHPHLEDDPLHSVQTVSGHEERVRTPGEITTWWRQLGPFGKR